MEYKLAVSHFTDNKFGISRFRIKNKSPKSRFTRNGKVISQLRRIKQAIHGSRKYPLLPSSVRGLDLIRFVV